MGIEPTPYIPVKRYLMEIAFDGGNYSGWQIQPHCLAVQQVIQEHLTKMYDKQPIHLIGSSRTDAGVHAQNFAASFLVPEQPAITMERVFKALNRRLPPDIKIFRKMPETQCIMYDRFGKERARWKNTSRKNLQDVLFRIEGEGIFRRGKIISSSGSNEVDSEILRKAEELHLPAIPSQPQLQYGKVPEKTEQQSS